MDDDSGMGGHPWSRVGQLAADRGPEPRHDEDSDDSPGSDGLGAEPVDTDRWAAELLVGSDSGAESTTDDSYETGRVAAVETEIEVDSSPAALYAPPDPLSAPVPPPPDNTPATPPAD